MIMAIDYMLCTCSEVVGFTSSITCICTHKLHVSNHVTEWLSGGLAELIVQV